MFSGLQTLLTNYLKPGDTISSQLGNLTYMEAVALFADYDVDDFIDDAIKGRVIKMTNPIEISKIRKFLVISRGCGKFLENQKIWNFYFKSDNFFKFPENLGNQRIWKIS